MQGKTSYQVIQYIKQNGQATGTELARFFDITPRAIRKQLANLLSKGVLEKIGKPPKVYYSIKVGAVGSDESVDNNLKKLISFPPGKPPV